MNLVTILLVLLLLGYCGGGYGRLSTGYYGGGIGLILLILILVLLVGR